MCLSLSFDIILTNSTTIEATNTAYENQSILISNCTVTINGSHSFSNLYLTNNAVIAHSPATTSTNYFLDLTVSNTLAIATNCAIDCAGKGCLKGRTVGNTTNGASSGTSGGSYGGLGGACNGTANEVYGDFRNPNELGSGAGAINYGGNGGGFVRITAGTAAVDGAISVNGGGAEGSHSGGGSGGGVYIDAGTLRGGGVVRANGGASSGDAGGGGGGRIAVYYENLDSGFDLTRQVMAWGGNSTIKAGSAGTVYFKHGANDGEIVVDNGNQGNAASTPVSVPAGSNYTENIVIRGGATSARLSTNGVVASEVLVNSNATLYLDGEFTMGSLILTNGAKVTHSAATTTNEYSMSLVISNLLSIATNCAIDCAGKGCLKGRTVGNTTNGASSGTSGGSYGGLGGACNGTANEVYGDFRNPNELGSGAGAINYGGNGGGFVRITAGTAAVDGAISVNGGGAEGSHSGGGSGGGVYIDAGTLRGGGVVRANGGASSGDAGGGGGGRIAVYYENLDNFSFSNQVTANGGSSTIASGSNGTIYVTNQAASLCVVEVDPDSALKSSVTNILIRFGSPVNSSTFTLDDLDLAGPGGSIAITGLVAESSYNFRAWPQAILTNEGQYTFVIGPAISNINDRPMDQPYTNFFAIDFTAPSAPAVTNFSAPPATNIVTSAGITLQGTRATNTEVWIAGSLAVASGSLPWSAAVSLTQGLNQVSVWARDLAGNISATNFVLLFADSIPPSVTGIKPANGAFTNSASVIELTYLETGSGLSLTGSALSVQRGGASIPGDWAIASTNVLTFTPSGSLLDGPYSINATLKDNVGLTSAPFASSFTLDSAPPARPVIAPITSPTTINHQLVSGSKETNTAILTNGTVIVQLSADTNWSYDFSLNAGSNVLTLAARDAALNLSPSTNVLIVYDNLAPGPITCLVANVQGCGTNLTLDWTAYDENAHGGDISFYTVYQAAASFTNVSQASSIATRPAGTKTCLVTGLARNETSHYAVIATDLTGLADSNVVSIAAAPLDTIAPPNPGNLAFQCFDDRLIVSWSPSANPDADLAGYRVYVTNETTGAEVSNSVTSYERTGLAFASAYQFRVAAFDNSTNESAGATATGYTLMANPTNVSAEPFSGMAALTWSASQPSANVDHYAVYCSETDFNNVSGMTVRASASGASASVAGLSDNITNFFAVTAINKSGGETKSVSAISAITRPDTNGPTLSNLKWSGIAAPSTVTSNGTFSISAADPAGVSRVDMSVGGVLLGSQTGAGPDFSAYWNVSATTNDGAHLLRIAAWDTLGNSNVVETNINVALGPPPAPVISSPTGGQLVNTPAMPVSGTADRYASSVSFFINDSPTGSSVSVGSAGDFASSITLASGTNLIQAAASNRAGQGQKSSSVSIVLDSSIPGAPANVQAEAREGGIIAISWWAPAGVNVNGYNLYRSTNSFETTNQALKVNSSLIAGLGYNDLPTADGTNYYRVETINQADTASLPSAQVSAYSDSTPPHAAIAISTTGRSIPSEHRYSSGAVTLNVSITEPLLTTPFLSVVPNQGAPIIIVLSKVAETNYTGSFVVSANTPSGTAYLNFSARDKTGNRGTAIDTNASLIVDNVGPVCSQFQVTPASPILNNSTNPDSVNAVLIFETNDVPVVTPELYYSLSVVNTSESSVVLSPLTSCSWSGALVLPTNAGITPETLTFSYKGVDALCNTGTLISVGSSAEVYQGTNPPPLEEPSGLTAVAKPAGAVDLAWNAVINAASYQIWRQDPGLTNFNLLASPAGTTYNDVALDGTNFYAVASVRSANGQQSVSELCAPVSAVAASNAPNAPEALTLQQAANGMFLRWQPSSLTAVPANYSLYRSTFEITPENISAVSAIISNIPATNVVDTAPLQGEVYYAVTAKDAAGNESSPSASVYTNVSLLPISSLSVVCRPSSVVTLSWTHSNPSAIDGFNVYLFTPPSDLYLLTSEALSNTVTSFTDTGYTPADRRYVVKAVDMVGTSAVESIGRSVFLPNLAVSLASGAQIKRGVMNRLNFGVMNAGSSAVSNAVLKVKFAGHENISAPFNLNANASNTISLVAGGYADLPDTLVITNTIEITAPSGEKAAINGASSHAVGTDLLTAEILNDEFTRGATGKARFALHNTCSEEIEIVMARASGAQASDQVRFKLMSPDGSIYAVAQVIQASGLHLFTLPDGVTVARIAPGAEFTCSEVEMNVPTNAPDSVTLKLEVDNIHYHYSYADHISIGGFASERAISIANTPYYAAITNVSPPSSLVFTNFILTGQAVNRSTTNAAAKAAVKLTVSISGFERVYDIFTDDAGNFSYTFIPPYTETGLYRAWAVHPDLLDKPVQAQFAISRVIVSPATFTVNVPRNYQQTLTVRVTPSAGLSLTNLSLVCPQTNQLPAGLHVETNSSAHVSLAPESQTANLPLTLWADNTVTNPSSFTLNVVSDDPLSGVEGRLWSSVTVNYSFSAANPVLTWSPSYIDTGCAISNSVTENLTLRNTGLADMEQVRLSLITTNQTPAPSWVILNSSSNLNTLYADTPSRPYSHTLSISFSPTNGVPSADYHFKLRVTSANAGTNDINLYVAVNESGKGEALFKIIDIYYGYQGNTGLNGALVKLTKQEGTTFTTNMVSDSLGEAWFQDLPVGRYKYQVSAGNHDSYIGTIWIRPGVTANEQVFLQYNLVTVEWSVEPIAIEDCYNIVLTATFETDVPAPVVIAEPMSVSLPDMAAGDVFNGEFILKNYGLIQAQGLQFILPAADEYFRIEIQGDITNQTVLAAHGELRVPYRVTCLSELDAQGGGGCYTWWTCLRMPYEYVTSCGITNHEERSFCFSRVYGSCPGGGGGGYTPTPGGGGGGEVIEYGGGGGGGTSPDKPTPPEQPITGGICWPCLLNPCFDGTVLQEKECEDPIVGGTCFGLFTEPISNSVIDVVNRCYAKSANDLVVSVPGGEVVWNRTCMTNQWRFAKQWQGLEFEYDYQDELSTIMLGNSTFEPINAVHSAYKFGDYYLETNAVGLPAVAGWRMEKTGSEIWRQFDQSGRLDKYGRGSNVIAGMIYDATNNLIAGVYDRNTNQVIWIERNSNGLPISVSDAASGGRQVQYEYDGAGQLTNHVDVLGRSTQYRYSGGKITQIVNPAGNVTYIDYDQYGYVSKVRRDSGWERSFAYQYDSYRKEYYSFVKTALGSVTERWFDQSGEEIKTAVNGRVTYDKNAPASASDPVYEYDANENITKITYPDGTFVTREYAGPNGEMSKEINEGGIATTYAYNSQGNLTNKVEASGTSRERKTIMTYDANNNQTASILVNPSGTNAITSWTYDEYGRGLTATYAMGGVTSNAWDQYGNLVSVTDPAGRARSMTYDLAGRPITETDFAENITSNSYDLAGNLVFRSVKDASAFSLQSTAYSHDIENRPTNIVHTIGNQQSKIENYQYDSDGNLVRQEQRAFDSTLLSIVSLAYNLDGKMTSKSVEIRGNTRTETYGYDDLARLVSIADATGTTTIEYDGDTERIKRVVGPLITREYTYDARGRMISSTVAVSGSSNLSHTSYMSHDAVGNAVSQTDPMGRNTQYGYDELAQRIMTINAQGGTNQFDYNFMGLISDLTDAKGNETAFEYDLLGRMVKKTYADATAVEYGYNNLGQLTEKEDAKGQKTKYYYDNSSRILTNEYYASASSNASKTVSYSYDPFGRMTAWTVAGGDDPGISGSFSYDDTNRTRSITVDFGPFSKTITYGYNAWGQKISCQYPDGTTYQYAYDSQGRLARIDIPGEGTVSFGLDQFGRLINTTLPGGTRKAFGYNAWQALATNQVVDPADYSLMNRIYSRNITGNILGQDTEHGVYDYGYDAIDQLTNVVVSAYSGPAGMATNEAFVYDLMGNRLWSSNDVATARRAVSYSANNLNQYTQVIESADGSLATNTFRHDLNGNMINQIIGDLITNQYFWDNENRLTEFRRNTTNNSVAAQYTYDPFGRRLSKAVNGVTNYYLYADEGLISEYDAFGSNVCSYGYAPDSLWMNNPVFLKQPSTTGPPKYYFYLSDHLGAPQKLIARNGSIVWSAWMDAFGFAHIDPASTVTNNLRFSSQYYDLESGLHYNFFRYYDPFSGRYLSRDLIGERSGILIYMFVGNSPVDHIDPLGLWTWPWQGCCRGQAYNKISSCCCEGNILSKNKINTGVRRGCEMGRIIFGLNFPRHCWIEWPGGSAGYWPGSIVVSPDPYSDPTQMPGANDTEYEPVIELSPCKYNIKNFLSCIKKAAGGNHGLPEYVSPDVDFLHAYDCRHWSRDIIEKCIRESKGCGK